MTDLVRQSRPHEFLIQMEIEDAIRLKKTLETAEELNATSEKILKWLDKELDI